MPNATNNPYNIKFLTIDNTFRLESGKVTDFTLKDVVKIHRRYYSRTTITELSKKHGLSPSTIKKIIVRFDCGDFDTFLKDYYPNELKNKDIEVFFINNRENLNDFLDYITIGYNIKSASQRLNLNLDCVKKLISVANKDPKYSSFFNDYSEAKNIRDKRRKKSTINK